MSAKMPLDPALAALCDKGVIELAEVDYLDSFANEIERSFPISE